MKRIKRENEMTFLNNNCFKISALILGFLFLILLFYSGCKIIKLQNCLNFVYILSVVLPLLIYFILYSDTKKNRIICSFIYLFLVLTTPFMFAKTFDQTVDGNSYHKIAIGYMKNGWNPVQESSIDWQQHRDIVHIPTNSKIDKWVDHYPKSTWMVAASMYSYTQGIESGKSINLLMMISLYLLGYSFFSQKFNKVKSTIFSIFISLNPILLSQMFSYYLDGLVGICFAIEFILLMMLDSCNKKSWLLWGLMLCICSIFVNLKFTGLLYSGVLAAIFYFYWLFKDKKNILKTFKDITLKFSTIFIIAICFIGANSYVRNFVDHRNPLYPLVGKDKEDIITTMQPQKFKNMNCIQKFGWSLFSKTENVTYQGNGPTLKFPFRLYQSELDTLYEAPDVRIGGFGPFFAISFVLGLLLYVIEMISLYRHKNPIFKYSLMFIIGIVVSCALVKEFWWARYAPQLYFIPVASLILSEFAFKGKIKHIIQTILSVILILNLSCYIKAYTRKFDDFKQVRNDLVELSKMSKVTLDFDYINKPVGVYFNLKDYNINFNVESIEPEEDVRWLISWKVRMRVND